MPFFFQLSYLDFEMSAINLGWEIQYDIQMSHNLNGNSLNSEKSEDKTNNFSHLQHTFVSV